MVLAITAVALVSGSCADECDELEYEWIGGAIGYYDDWAEATEVEVGAPEGSELSEVEQWRLETFRSEGALMVRVEDAQVLRGERFERGLATESLGREAPRVVERGGTLLLGHRDGGVAGMELRSDGSVRWLGPCAGSATEQLSGFAGHLAATTDLFAGASAADVARALVAEDPGGPLSRQFEEWWRPSSRETASSTGGPLLGSRHHTGPDIDGRSGR
ncbi:hypothetical protein [Actinomarinicola tropica]|uniref:Uncharacterized protein n=1 Tax=Actinomarinicola tropica TaxID=2789776 RepID=A0A5Q2RJJ4_9ACTN|nr:hypothetical protein [Actinomarinicola tropica]QGG94197.1 hypothetical protein GH723_03260 [Actinomarinicola tropica]